MKGFHWYVQLLVTANVEDTQCGFKLLTHRAAKTLFGSLHLYRWAFDTELIFLAEWLHIPIAEVNVINLYLIVVEVVVLPVVVHYELFVVKNSFFILKSTILM